MLWMKPREYVNPLNHEISWCLNNSAWLTAFCSQPMCSLRLWASAGGGLASPIPESQETGTIQTLNAILDQSWGSQAWEHSLTARGTSHLECLSPVPMAELWAGLVGQEAIPAGFPVSPAGGMCVPEGLGVCAFLSFPRVAGAGTVEGRMGSRVFCGAGIQSSRDWSHRKKCLRKARLDVAWSSLV